MMKNNGFLESALIQKVWGKIDLEKFKKKKIKPRHLIGYKVGHHLNIGAGLIGMAVLKELSELGIDTHVVLDDWDYWLGEKTHGKDHLGNLQLKRTVMTETLRLLLSACLKSVGGDEEKVKFVYSSDKYGRDSRTWNSFIHISENIEVKELYKIGIFLGSTRSNKDKLNFNSMISSLQEIVNVFVFYCDIVQSGSFNKNLTRLIRKTAKKVQMMSELDSNFRKTIPVAVFHKYLPSLNRKSVENSSASRSEENIFFGDSEELIRKKITSAFCLPQVVKNNAIVTWVELLIFGLNRKFEVRRKPEHGGNITYNSFSEFLKAYKKNEIHPQDVKNSLADYVINTVIPIQEQVKSELSETIGAVI